MTLVTPRQDIREHFVISTLIYPTLTHPRPINTDPSSRPSNPLAPLNEIELSAQRTALGSLESAWRMQREREEYEAARLLGWTKQAETYNGRFAMFFLVVGLLTEYWTGVSLPGQIEEMLRVAGVIDMS